MPELELMLRTFAIYGLGVIALVQIGVYVSSRVWHLGAKHAKNGNTNLRDKDQEQKYDGRSWPDVLVLKIGEMATNTENIKQYLENGLNEKIDKVATVLNQNTEVIKKCHDVTERREQESYRLD